MVKAKDVWSFSVEESVNEYWNKPWKFFRRLAPWIRVRRWSGLRSVEKSEVRVLDSFVFQRGSDRLIFDAFVEVVGFEKMKRLQKSFFLPIFITKNPAYELKHGKCGVQIVCSDAELWILEAELTPEYNRSVLRAFLEGMVSKTANEGFIKFRLVEPLNRNLEKAKLSLKVLGEGDTTNVVVEVKLGNTSFVVKTYKEISSVNPEPEFLEALSDQDFKYAPKLLGKIEYKPPRNKNIVIGVLESFEENVGDGYKPFLDNLTADLLDLHDEVSTRPLEMHDMENLLFDKLRRNSLIKDMSRRLGRIIAEFHYVSANCRKHGFEARLITRDDVRRWVERAGKNLEDCFEGIDYVLKKGKLSPIVSEIVEVLSEKLDRSRGILTDKLRLFYEMVGMTKIRIHQDLHLAQMLSRKVGKKYDFIIIDFEGDPQMKGVARKEKESPLRDLGAMERSFGYIKYASLRNILMGFPYDEALAFIASMCARSERGLNFKTEFDSEALRYLIEYTNRWEMMIEESVFDGYIQRSRELDAYYLLKDDRLDEKFLRSLVKLWKLDKAILEIKYELSHRIQNLIIPLQGLLDCLRH